MSIKVSKDGSVATVLLEMEALAVGGARLTHDHAEGVAAFKEKRAPKFKGRWSSEG